MSFLCSAFISVAFLPAAKYNGGKKESKIKLISNELTSTKHEEDYMTYSKFIVL